MKNCKILINRRSVDGKVYENSEINGFMDRIDFINQTGVFISPNYFRMTVDDFRESGLTKDEFIKQYLQDKEPLIIDIPLNGTLKCIIDDEDVTAIGCDQCCEDRSAIDIINDVLEQEDKKANQFELWSELFDFVYGNFKNEITANPELSIQLGLILLKHQKDKDDMFSVNGYLKAEGFMS